MAIEIKVPSVGESITSGVLGRWQKKDGEYVKSGDVLFEIETDKVTSEVFAETNGALKHWVKEGTEVQIGQVVASIDEKAPAPAVSETAPAPAKEEKKAAPAPAMAGVSSEKPLSPAVRHLVDNEAINPEKISGSGKGGRILKGDILSHLENGSSAGPRTSRRKMTPLRKKIASRLVNAQHEAAMLTTFNEVDMSTVMNMRTKYKERFEKVHGVKLGFMSFFVKAVVRALKKVPGINAQIDGDEIVDNNFYDIGVAISTEKGLVVPNIRNADQLTAAGIESAIVDYAVKARAGKIAMTDLEGGVFTITNGGTFGSLLSTPIINAPQSAILGMHAIQDRPMAVNGEVVIRPMMYIALSYDHRIVDGKEAVTFLVQVKEFIENPGIEFLDL
jgi:2-oxoglutarate dehydrogenase E2 component (dihydrolipoamide succinyltransferase)